MQHACHLVFCWALLLCPIFGYAKVDYLTQIKPILSTKCYSCHGALKQKGKLRLETRDLMLKGEAIIPGNPQESLILERVLDEGEDRMPPPEEGAALKPAEIELLRQWISEGANAPDEPIPSAPDHHWAFQSPKKAKLPDKVENPIDFLLDKQHARLGLKTQGEAQRSILLRRLYLDLIGLPPSAAQLKDQRPWETIVDELLENPHHGERWARHWMDIWRYTDWYGLGAQLRNSQKHIWRWRDWIVESLNEDKGYDRMILEMLAADELFPEDTQALRGTGFLARNYYLFNRTTWLDSTIEHVGKAFVGLTLNCAKCHDHKYDPITHEDYYSFRAIFEPHQVRLDPLPGETDFEKDGLPRVFDDNLDIKTFLHIRGDPKNPDKNRTIEPSVPAILASFAPEIKPVKLTPYAFAPATRDYVRRDRTTIIRGKIEKAEKALVEARKEFEKKPVKAVPKAAPEEDILTKAEKPDQIHFVEEFEKPNPKRWEIIGKDWEYKDGYLHQTKPTRESDMARLREPHPKDFELTCRYKHTGGATYKSVTFRFDQSSTLKNANFVYTSAHEPEKKLQIAYTRNGQHTYPPTGKVPTPIEIGKIQELRFAVRDLLINVWLNGKFMLAYNLPDRPTDGHLSLSGFDATVAFDSLSIRSLPEDIKLKKAGNQSPAKPKANPRHAIDLAEATLAMEKAELVSLVASLDADLQKTKHDATEETIEASARLAARRQVELALAKAKRDLLATPHDAAKTTAAGKRIEDAKKKLENLKDAKPTYTSLKASKKALESPAHKEANYPAIHPSTSTGRRTALAKWITSRRNPLTARVIVNHVWMRHFGEPLVESVFDFGLRAKKPKLVELLDHLSADFMDSGWSFRHLHKVITNSRSYRFSASTINADKGTTAKDPENHYLWRMNTRRMEAQVVRDCLLQLAGKLDTSLGGPSLKPGSGMRRSIYFQHSRDQQDKFLKIFNDADHLQCYRRSESVVPQQALALSNSKLALEMAVEISRKIQSTIKSKDMDAFTEQAFFTLLGRMPEKQETKECLKFRQQLSDLLSKQKGTSSSERIQTRLVHALMNHNDFISIR